MTHRTIKSRLAEKLDPVIDGRAHKYETRDAFPILYGDGSTEQNFDLTEERARLAHHQANNEALKESQLRGELLPAELVIEMGAALVAAARAKVLAIHSKCRSRFPSIEQDVADEIETLSREALSELGNDGLPADLRRRIAPASRRLESAAETDDQ